MMNRKLGLLADATAARFVLSLLILLGWLIATGHSQEQRQPETSTAYSGVQATHVLGFEGVRRNIGGELSIQENGLEFQPDQQPAEQVSMAAIRNISLGDEDRQVGGVPMMLGKAAVPFGGGRAVSLFSHKKYDSLTIEYVDSNGGFHGGVFRLKKGEAKVFKDNLIAHGAHISEPQEAQPVSGIANEAPGEAQQWSVLVRRVDPGGTSLDPSFSNAIYENLLKDLSGSKHFKNVYRSGDRNANAANELLILKTLVTKYAAGNETRRAVTTLSGATKVSVLVQLLTRDGRIVLEREVQGNVRFYGDNLRATSKVAHNSAKILARSNLPELSTPVAQKGSEWSGNDFSNK